MKEFIPEPKSSVDARGYAAVAKGLFSVTVWSLTFGDIQYSIQNESVLFLRPTTATKVIKNSNGEHNRVIYSVQ